MEHLHYNVIEAHAVPAIVQHIGAAKQQQPQQLWVTRFLERSRAYLEIKEQTQGPAKLLASGISVLREFQKTEYQGNVPA